MDKTTTSLTDDELYEIIRRNYHEVNADYIAEQIKIAKVAGEKCKKTTSKSRKNALPGMQQISRPQKNMDLKIFTDNIEGEAISQIYGLAKQPAFSNAKIRIMPDVHAGKGCVIGFTADLGDKVIPSIVGVDIGCGMLTVELGNIEIDFEKLDNLIREKIPHGRNVHERSLLPYTDLSLLKCFHKLKNISWLEHSLGTLGGGNHFIEIDVDDNGNKYLIIHSGSRNLGKQVAEYYQNLAIEKIHGKAQEIANLIAEYKAAGREKEISDAIADIKKQSVGIPKELCYLTDNDREDYLHDMKICQDFAVMNRKMMANIILDGMGWKAVSSFETIHNYIELETNMVRKGAISAKRGERVLIPINMRDGCIIGIGKGNDDWNQSAPHGAGRLMSRGKAKEILSLEEFHKTMEGIYTTSVGQETLDESPMAYKSIDDIVDKIDDTVEIENIIKPIYNFKAN